MSMLRLPYEILKLIAQELNLKDLNALLRSHSHLHASLNPNLYARNLQDHQGSALWWAANHGSVPTLQRLLDAGATLDWESHYWPSTGTFPRARHLRYRKLKSRDAKLRSKRHPISNAAKNGHTAVVAKLLACGAHINYKSRWGRSPLALAARGGHFDTVQLLVHRGACLLSVDLDGRRPIAYAAREGHDVIADYLLMELRRRYPGFHATAKADIQILLECAAQRGNEARVKYLLEKECADVNFQFPVESSPPLLVAVKSASMGMIKLLLEYGANPNGRASPKKISSGNTIPETPFRLAINREDGGEIVRLLLSYGADPRVESNHILWSAAHQGKSEAFLLLVDAGADISSPRLQRDLMREAIRSDSKPIVNALAERGVETEYRRRPCTLRAPRRIVPGSVEAIERDIKANLINARFAERYDSDT